MAQAIILNASGRSAAAELECRRAIDLDHSPGAHLTLGIVLTAEGRLEEAISVLEKANAECPSALPAGRFVGEAFNGGTTRPTPISL